RMAMKFWRNAAALLMVFHPETTHTGNHSTPKDVKNEGRPGYVDENKGTSDKMSETMSDICARLKRFLQKSGVTSSPNTSKVPRTYRTAGSAESLVWCPISELTIGETPSPPRQADRGAPFSPRLMSAPRRATLSPRGRGQ